MSEGGTLLNSTARIVNARISILTGLIKTERQSHSSTWLSKL